MDRDVHQKAKQEMNCMAARIPHLEFPNPETAEPTIGYAPWREIGEDSSETAEPTICDTPWREIGEDSSEKLKSDIKAYRPVQGSNANHANILLIGAVGSGKSSFFNTINSIFRGHVTAQASSGSADHSVTTQFRKYKVRCPETGGSLKFRLCDTAGLENDQGIDVADVVPILDGNVPDKYLLNQAAGINPDTRGYNKTPSLSDRIHCVAFVVDACSVDVFQGKMLEKIYSIEKQIYQRGIPQVVILTKVDMACPRVAEDVDVLFRSKVILDVLGNAAKKFRLPRSHVFPVKNYEDEVKLNEHVDVPALFSVLQMLRFCDDYLYNFMQDDDSE